MVVGAFPAAKLGALLLKQISKPIANIVKTSAKNSPVFRKYVCMPPAHFYNWCEIKAKMWILNLGKPVNIPVLNEAMAIELGANLLGEGIIFVIAAGILINEYTRSARKEAAKEEAKRLEMEQVQQMLQELFFAYEKQGMQMRELTRHIHDLENRMVQKPWVPKSNTPGSKGGDDDSPPPPPATAPQQPIISMEEIINEGEEPQQVRVQRVERATSSLILNAASEVKEELFSTDVKSTREPSLVTTALNFLYKDVYRVPLSM